VLIVTVIVVVLAAPAAPAGGAVFTTGPAAGSGEVVEGQPSAAEVKAAQDAARAARNVADQRAGELAAAQGQLAAAASRAGLALEGYRTAVLTQQFAQRDADRARDRLAESGRRLRAAQQTLGGWVRDAYASGGMLGRSPATVTLLSGASLDELDLGVVVLGRCGQAARRDLDQVRRARAEQQAAADAADAAQQVTLAATVAAATARQQADAAVQQQRAAVDRSQSDLAGARDAAGAANEKAARLARARALADARAQAWQHQVTGPVGTCSGADLSGYANGMIPLAALCPLWGAPGEYLRADAAYAFGRLSQAYAAAFGTPLCVTDSYRSYAEQVALHARKPRLAAVPGTSNHGWATAADLCGGIESFGTATHTWMLLNAPAFGWFHPAWAEPTGSLPEPWHWEFAG
jgi:hypothetical protein